jgi:hypothetical protein
MGMARHSGLITIEASAGSLEEAHEIVGRLTQAGFARNSMEVQRSEGDRFAVHLHTREPNRARAERAISGGLGTGLGTSLASPVLLSALGGAFVAGAGLWALWRHNRSSADSPRDVPDKPEAEQWSPRNPQATTIHLGADQARSSENGFLVLNGAPDGPATTIERDRSGQDVRVKSAEEAMQALDGRFKAVRLIEHRFPDSSGDGVHTVKVWVPDNLAAEG